MNKSLIFHSLATGTSVVAGGSGYVLSAPDSSIDASSLSNGFQVFDHVNDDTVARDLVSQYDHEHNRKYWTWGEKDMDSELWKIRGKIRESELGQKRDNNEKKIVDKDDEVAKKALQDLNNYCSTSRSKVEFKNSKEFQGYMYFCLDFSKVRVNQGNLKK